MKDIRFDGLDDVLAKLDDIADISKVNAALGKACALVERSAKTKAKKGETGELARSIKSKVENGVGVIYTPLEYAPYVEYGTGLFAEEQGRQDVPWCYQDDKGEWHTTSGMPPQPFMRPALYENQEKIKRIIGESLTND